MTDRPRPGEKCCAKCGATVQPAWRAVALGDDKGWVGKSNCPVCSNESVHIAGVPGFTLLAGSVHQVGGDLDKLPSL
jgi:uncharacterized protein (UPF0212 family)